MYFQFLQVNLSLFEMCTSAVALEQCYELRGSITALSELNGFEQLDVSRISQQSWLICQGLRCIKELIIYKHTRHHEFREGNICGERGVHCRWEESRGNSDLKM